MSGGAGNLAGLQAGGAHVQALGRAIDECPNALNVRVPAAGSAHVGVRDTLTKPGTLSAYIADGSHWNSYQGARKCAGTTRKMIPPSEALAQRAVGHPGRAIEHKAAVPWV